MELSELHDCEKCRGKIVAITIDVLGVTRCGYCNKIVDYERYFNIQNLIEKSAKKLIMENNNVDS